VLGTGPAGVFGCANGPCPLTTSSVGGLFEVATGGGVGVIGCANGCSAQGGPAGGEFSATFGGFGLIAQGRDTGILASSAGGHGIDSTAVALGKAGVFGHYEGGSSQGNGVVGTSNASGGVNSFGVQGKETGSNGTGVAGFANTGATAVGVLGHSDSGLAGKFEGPVQVTGNLKLDAKVTSPMWHVSQLFSNKAQSGGLPLSGSFTTHGGLLMIFASGSGFSSLSNATIGMAISIDGTSKGAASSFTNESASHKAFVANPLVVSGLAAGSHTISLDELSGTTTDLSDRFSLTVMELPI